MTPRLEEELANDIDLEREDLLTVLDRALALLPPATRTVLIEKYVHESPLAEVGHVQYRVESFGLAIR